MPQKQKASLQSGKEYPEPDEDRHIKKAIAVFKKVSVNRYKPGEVMRAFHPKMHGLVRAELVVEDSLPQHLQAGIFQPGKKWNAWVRFSNAKPKVTADIKKAERGMAIKVLGVPGEKILEHKRNAMTQDFVAFTSKTLVTHTVRNLTQGLAAIAQGPAAMFLYALNPAHWGMVGRAWYEIRCALCQRAGNSLLLRLALPAWRSFAGHQIYAEAAGKECG